MRLTPKAIDVQYTRENGKLHAVIYLSHGLHGTFRWQGRSYPIPSGALNLTIPEAESKYPEQSVINQKRVVRN